MKKPLLLVITAALVWLYGCNGVPEIGEPLYPPSGEPTPSEDVEESLSTTSLYIADPFIFYENGKYYAYGTGGYGQGDGNNGINVYVSEDLVHFYFKGVALRKDNSYAPSTPPINWSGFWAPEVYKVGNMYYMYYTRAWGNDSGVYERMCAATAPTPLGPFVNPEHKPMTTELFNIDNNLFIDDDGTAYMYYSHESTIRVCKLSPDLLSMDEASITECLVPDNDESSWELQDPYYPASRIVEAPEVIKHKGVYYMAYSAHPSTSPLYGVSYATASNPMGPWTKAGYPIIQLLGGLYGTGHNCFFTDAEGNLKTAFHALFSETETEGNLHSMYITNASFSEDGKLQVDENYTKALLVAE